MVLLVVLDVSVRLFWPERTRTHREGGGAEERERESAVSLMETDRPLQTTQAQVLTALETFHALYMLDKTGRRRTTMTVAASVGTWKARAALLLLSRPAAA